MKTTYTIIALIISINFYSQSKFIEGNIRYTYTTNLYKEYIEKYTMIFNKDYSYSIESNIELKKGSVEIDKTKEGTTKTYSFSRKNLTKKYFFFNKKNVFFRKNLGKKTVIVKEEPQTWNWKITSEKKVIGNFECQKATTQFRGRKYIAWFTLDIPYQYGPWKFYGLPGVILRVYDTERKFYITATKVNFTTNNKTIPFKRPDLDKKIKTVSIERFKDLNDKYIDEVFARMSSKMGKGYGPLKRDKNCSDCGGTIEIFDEKK